MYYFHSLIVDTFDSPNYYRMRPHLILFIFLIAGLSLSNAQNPVSSSQEQMLVNFVKPFHASIVVTDIDNSIDWYTRAFNIKVFKRGHSPDHQFKNALLGNEFFILELKQGKNALKKADCTIDDDEHICGFYKIGFLATNFESYRKSLNDREIKIHKDPLWDLSSSYDYIKLEDPDGNIMEIIPGDYYRNPEDTVNEIHLFKFGVIVDNLEESVNWYEQHLGVIFYKKLDFDAQNYSIRFLRSDNFVLELAYIGDKTYRKDDLELAPDELMVGIEQVSFKVENIESVSSFFLTHNTTIHSNIRSFPDAYAKKHMVIRDNTNLPIQILQ